MTQANPSGLGATIPTSVSDRQGFNKRWYANDDSLQIFRPTSGAEVADAFSAILQDETISPGQFQITCGRHCYEGFVYNANTRAIIDMTGLKAYGEATVDGKRTVYVDVGMGNWDMYRLLNNVYQKTLPAGSCYSVGLGGHITGGGYGVLSRLYGLSIDYLTAVDIVVGDRASGARTIEKCSANHHSDLFWAVRGGGGGQFGIITRYYFALDTLPDSPTYIYIYTLGLSWRQEMNPLLRGWNWLRSTQAPLITESQFSGILNCFQDIWTDQTESSWKTFGIFHANHKDAGNLSLSSITVYSPSLHDKQADFESELLKQYRKRQQEAAQIVPPYTADFALKGHPYVPSVKSLELNADNFRCYTYLEGMQQLNGSGPNRYGKYKSAYHTKKLTPAMISAAYNGLTQTVVDSKNQIVDMQSSLIQLDAYGGKINKVPPDATAVPQRSSILKLQYQSYWDTSLLPGQDNPVLEAAHVNWLNQMYQDIYQDSGGVPKGDGTEGCYYNYPDINIGSTEPGTPPWNRPSTSTFWETCPGSSKYLQSITLRAGSKVPSRLAMLPHQILSLRGLATYYPSSPDRKRAIPTTSKARLNVILM